MSRRSFDEERAALEETLRDVASFAGRDEGDARAFQSCADTRAVLDPAAVAALRSGLESTVR